ncbi:MAG TPA: hypothetical protein PK079_24040 [Leptospiraceae bacterium]|nr:hypothetical protein [Leptospiraceae bacterium]HMZ66485.1 hypothetical protein [Leptospiraceae bacterium]HNA10027.1 hypothetical protein [Leptospiraceae bacterium]HNC00254.1 hypothetical protein [Leptospiraceae bacterium]HNC59388.1 hypothetical protein [Leptospiraceae bacterium]
MMNNIRLWVLRNAIDYSNGALVLGLFWFLAWGLWFRVFISYPEICHRWTPINTDRFFESFFFGVQLIILSLLFNWLYEFVNYLDNRKFNERK